MSVFVRECRRPPRRLRRLTRQGLFVAAAGVSVASGPALYPLWLLLHTWHRPDPVRPGLPQGEWPALAVVVPAFREQRVIAAKVADLRANGYPGSLEIIVVADDAATAAAARGTGARVLEPGRRLGKSVALNAGVGSATAPVVVLNDANTVLEPGSLARLVRWFADDRVGAVAGEKRAEAEGHYWRFESWLKRREMRLGTMIGLVGELAAVRADCFRSLPSDVAVDDLWLALDVAEQGRTIVYEPTSVATELDSPSLGQMWERRTRVVAGALDVIMRRRDLLVGHPPISAQLWGHRLLRMTVGPLAHAALLGWAGRRLCQSPLRHPGSALFVAGHAVAGATVHRAGRGRTTWRWEVLVGQVALLQAVGLGGLVRYLRGDRPAVWPKPERQAL